MFKIFAHTTAYTAIKQTERGKRRATDYWRLGVISNLLWKYKKGRIPDDQHSKHLYRCQFVNTRYRVSRAHTRTRKLLGFKHEQKSYKYTSE